MAAILPPQQEIGEKLGFACEAPPNGQGEHSIRCGDSCAFLGQCAMRSTDSILFLLQRLDSGKVMEDRCQATINGAQLNIKRVGLTPYEALYAGTAAVAMFLESNGGLVAKGRDADLLLLDANPLDDILNSSRIHGVMLRGTWWPITELDARLERFVVQDDR